MCKLAIALHMHRRGKFLGSGQFGDVFKGQWFYCGRTMDVAVKTLNTNSSEQEKVKLLQEAATMGQFAHPHVVQLLGIVTVQEPVCCTLHQHLHIRTALATAVGCTQLKKSRANTFVTSRSILKLMMPQ